MFYPHDLIQAVVTDQMNNWMRTKTCRIAWSISMKRCLYTPWAKAADMFSSCSCHSNVLQPILIKTITLALETISLFYRNSQLTRQKKVPCMMLQNRNCCSCHLSPFSIKRSVILHWCCRLWLTNVKEAYYDITNKFHSNSCHDY